MIKKRIFLLILIFLLIFTTAVAAISFKDFINFPREKLKEFLETQLTNALGREIKIGSLKGNIYRWIILHDVAVANGKKLSEGTFVRAKRIDLKFSLARTILSGGNILPYIREVEIHSPEILVERTEKETWLGIDLGQVVPEENPQGASFKIEEELDIKLKIIDGAGKYLDWWGWKEFGRISKPFSTSFQNFNVEATVTGKGRVDYKASVIARKKNIDIFGFADLSKNDFDFRVQAKGLQVDYWLPYILPIKELQFQGGITDLDMRMRPRTTKFSPGETPMRFDLALQVSEGVLAFPGLFKKPFIKASGLVYLDTYGVSIQKINAEVAETPVQLNGRIQGYEKATIKMNIKSLAKAKLEKAQEFMAALENYQLSGEADVSIDFSGFIENAKIEGTIAAKNGSVWDIPFSEATFVFSLKDEIFKYEIPYAALANGNAKMSGQAQFIKNTLFFDFQGENMRSDLLLADINSSGRVSVNIKAEGTLDDITMNVQLGSEDLLVQAQRITSANGAVHLVPDRIIFNDFNIKTNDKDMKISGWLDKNAAFVVNFDWQELKVKPIKEWGNLEGEGFARGTISGHPQTTSKNTSYRGLKEIKFDLQTDLKNVTLLNESLQELKGDISWDGQEYSFKNIEVKKNQSILKGSGVWRTLADFSLFIDTGSQVQLHEWQFLQSNFSAALHGSLGFSGNVSAENYNYYIKGSALLENIVLSTLSLDKLSGDFLVSNNILSAENAEVKINGDSYQLKGFFDFKPLFSKSQDTTLNFSLVAEVQEAKADSLFSFLRAFQKEIIYRNALLGQDDLSKDSADKVMQGYQNAYAFRQYWPLLINLGQEDTILEQFSLMSINEKAAVQEKEQSFSCGEDALISGTFAISLQDNRPELSLNLVLDDVDFGSFSFKQAVIDAFTEPTGKIQSSIIAKDGSLLDGAYDVLGIETSYQKDYLIFQKTYIKHKKTSMENIIQGSVPLSPWWEKEKVLLPIDIILRFEKNYLGLLGLFNKNISSIKNDGEVILHVGGSLASPNISAQKIDLRNATVQLSTNNLVLSPLQIITSNIALKDNVIHIKKATLLWAGEETSRKENFLDISGDIGFSHLNFLKPMYLKMNFDLAMNNTKFDINLSGLYQGSLLLSDAALKGPYIFSMTERAAEEFETVWGKKEIGPLLSAKVLAEDGTYYLSTTKQQSSYFPLFYNIEISIGRNVEVMRGGNIWQARDMNSLQSIFSHLNLSLHESREPLIISGSLNKPLLSGSVIFDEGSLSIFGRSFMLSDKEEQRRYFGAQTAKLQDNQAVFSIVDTDEEKTMRVEYHLVAQTTIEIPEETVVTVTAAEGVVTPNTSTITTWKEIDYLVLVSGHLDEISSYKFEKYTATNGLLYLEGEPYVLQDPITGEVIQTEKLRVLTMDLAPTVLKSAYAAIINREEFDSKTAFRDVTRTQVNIMARSLLRPIEKNIARSVGLYDLKLRHDFGKNFTSAVGLEREQVVYTEEELQALDREKIAGLDLIAELMKGRLYLTLNTSIDRGLIRKYWDFHFASYRLTWYLFRQVVFDEISLNYSNQIVEDPDILEVLSLEVMHAF